MSVDKFGRFSEEKFKRSLRGPKGEGFSLTPEGEYDIKNKRLKFVQDPVDEKDAVNLNTLEKSTMLYGDRGFNANNNRIVNVRTPESDGDVATKSYVDNNIPFTSNKVKYWSFSNKRLAAVSDPKDMSDVVNLQYFEKHIPVKTESSWGFGNKRLANTALPQETSDAVNVEYLFNNVLCKRPVKYSTVGETSFHHSSEFDAQGHVISNIGKPRNLDDVVTKRYLKEALADLGYAIYHELCKKRSMDLPTVLTKSNDWKNAVTRELDSTNYPWNAWHKHIYSLPNLYK